MKVSFKSCARCGGDMRRDTDMYGAYHQCVQCGYLLDVHEPAPPKEQAPTPIDFDKGMFKMAI